jgi:hypothetical protein
MTKIHTVEQLDDALSEAIVWRKKELASLRALVQSRRLSHSKLNCLIRSGIAILYAHWEGFIKEAGTSYLEFVSTQRLKYKELAPNFIALAMKKQLDQAKQTTQATVYVEVVEFLLSDLSQRSHISCDSKSIETHSNLSSKVLENIMCTLGLDYSIFRTKEKLIDQKLLKKRNNIAHGKYLTVDESEFIEIYEEVINMMELFRNQIINSAFMGKYKRE